MEDLIKEIIVKAYQISTKTKADVFVNFSGHVNNLKIFFYKNGWNENIEWDFNIDIYLDIEKDAKTKLQLVLKELEKLERGE